MPARSKAASTPTIITTQEDVASDFSPMLGSAVAVCYTVAVGVGELVGANVLVELTGGSLSVMLK